MARPSRCRRICLEPEYDSFAPCGKESAEPVLLTVDEFETIRLIDYERQTHEQCARQMGVSRTTVTEMYERARGKLAHCLVNGRPLRIAGGNYKLCDGGRCRHCKKFNTSAGTPARKEASTMKIAVTYENGAVFQHFGHTQQFKVYDVDNGQVTASEILDTNGQGHGALAGFLTAAGVDTLICGGIGGGAKAALANAGIQLYGGVSGSADEAVAQLLAGTLAYNPGIQCSHHDHAGSCGEDKHGCHD